MSTLHDNEIISYVVNFKTNKIMMYTEYQDLNKVKKEMIEFTGVLSHYFENEISGSIILEVEEFSVEDFIKDNRRVLEERKNYCWPVEYETIQELMEKIKENKCIYYVIYSSYGLSGWILAQGYKVSFY